MKARRRYADALRSRALEWIVPTFVEPRLNAPYLTMTRRLEEFRRRPREQRRDWQHERLARVLAHTRAHVPHYRDLWGAGGPELALDDLPAVSKAEIRAQQDRFLSEDRARIPSLAKKTGGTTGDPWHYPLDRLAWAAMYAARLAFLEEAGYRYGARAVVLGSPPSLVSGGRSLKSRVRRVLENQVVAVAGTEVHHEASLRRARAAAALDAGLWYGYAGTVAAMADAVLAEGVRLPGPTAIVTSAETLQPDWRARIVEAFGAPVHDQYGCNDGGLMSQSCAAGRFHVAESLSIVEVLDEDGRPVPDGVEGDVAVTNLHQLTLPFLRYRIGDRAVIRDGRCACGYDGVVVESFEGRTWDRLRLPDGRVLGSLAFYPLFLETPEVRRWQIVQRAADAVVVRLEPQGGSLHEDVVHRVRDYVAAQVGPAVSVTVTTSEAIPQTAGGKHRAVRGLEPTA